MLSVLACKFPIFTAGDDVEAMMELAAIFGRKTVEKCAKMHSTLSCHSVCCTCLFIGLRSRSDIRFQRPNDRSPRSNVARTCSADQPSPVPEIASQETQSLIVKKSLLSPTTTNSRWSPRLPSTASPLFWSSIHPLYCFLLHHRLFLIFSPLPCLFTNLCSS